jgi:hypothetical protein
LDGRRPQPADGCDKALPAPQAPAATTVTQMGRHADGGSVARQLPRDRA